MHAHAHVHSQRVPYPHPAGSIPPAPQSRSTSGPMPDLEPADGGARKRRRPNTLVACDSCVKRKTRCDMLAGGKCFRCSEYNTECTFAGRVAGQAGAGDGGSDGAGTSGSPPPSREWAYISRLEQRLARVEVLAERGGGGLSVPPPSRGQEQDDPIKEYYKMYGEDGERPTATHPSPDSRRLGAYLHVSSMLLLNHYPTFADPEAQGIVEGREMRRLIDDFPRLIPDTIPLSQLFHSSNAASHPLVRSCILHHLGGYTVEDKPSKQTLSNTALVLRNLAIVPAAEPAVAVALGLLILSLSPASRTDISLPRTPDPYEASSRALRVVTRLGADRAARRFLSGVEQDSVVDQAVLWYAISHRAAWVDILAADCFGARPSLAPPLSSLPLQRMGTRHDLVHLHFESRLIEIIAPLTAALIDARTAEFSDTSLLLLALQRYSADLAAWRADLARFPLPSSLWLHLHSLQLEMMAHLKVSNDFRPSSDANPGSGSGPDPLAHAHFGLIRECSSSSRRAATDLVRLVVHDRLIPARLPAYNLTLCFAGYALICHARAGAQDAVDLASYRSMLVDAHVSGGRYVEMSDARRAPGEYTRAVSEERGLVAQFAQQQQQQQQILDGGGVGNGSGAPWAGQGFTDASWMFDTTWLDQFVSPGPGSGSMGM